MRWKDLGQSDNVEDRRGQRGGLPIGGRGIAIGGGGGMVMLVVILLYLFMGGDPSKIASQLPTGGGGPSAQFDAPADPSQFSAEEQEAAKFVSAVLKSTEDVWTEQFRRAGRTYEKPKLVLFTGQVQSACGVAGASVGPFYCPEDRKIYIDLSFFGELRRQFRAPGDFAQAYVIAHEVGHHVQNLLGLSDQVHAARRQVSETEFNELSVRLELQADFLAGVWAHHAEKYKGILEAGDVEEALNAATAIGDDNIQKQAQGYAVPDSFTHGTGEQRVRWFRKGLQSGDINQGDTFKARDL